MMGTPRSLLLITADCLRADHVGFMGYDHPTTPFLDSLAAESWVFQNAIVTGSPTFYSFPGIMASRYALALGRDVLGIAPDEPTLATVLSESGYATAAFLAANVYLSPRFGYDAGFSTFRDFLDVETADFTRTGNGRLSRVNRRIAELTRRLNPLKSLYEELYFQYCQRFAVPGRLSFDALRRFPAADVLVDQSRDWLANIAGRPFFLWLHLMDPHAPYYPAEEALGLLGYSHLDASRARYLNSYWNRGQLDVKRYKPYLNEVTALYDASIRWLDAQVARLVDTLRRQCLWDNVVMVVCADHGEEFLEHGGRYHSPSKLVEELIHVPMLLRVPGRSKTESVKAQFSFLDLAPTLLAALDIPAPANFRGRARWKELQNGRSWHEPVITESIAGCQDPSYIENRIGSRVLAIREGRYKLVLDFGSHGESLFDLEIDSCERHPLPRDAERAVRRRLLDQARHHIEDSLQSRDPDARLRARLRDLQLGNNFPLPLRHPSPARKTPTDTTYDQGNR